MKPFYIFIVAYFLLNPLFSQTWTTYKTSNTSTTISNNVVTSIAEDKQGNKWFGTTDGFSKFDGKSWETNAYINLGLTGFSIKKYFIDSDGIKYFVTSDGELIKIDGNNRTTFKKDSLLALSYINRIARDLHGNIWFGTTSGALKFDGKNWTQYTNDDGLIGDNVFAIVIDSSGNIWFGTDNGVSIFDGIKWTSYNKANGLVANYINALALDSKGNKWFGTYEGVSKFDGTQWTNYTTANGLAENSIRSIAIDTLGNIWCGTMNKGVSMYDGEKWTTYNTTKGLIDNRIGTIFIDSKDDKWFGTNNGVSKFDGVNWISYSCNGLISNLINSVAIDAKDNKWVGTNYGVSKFDGHTWTTYTTKDGLVNNEVNVIAVDKNDNKWFGTKGGGLSKFDGNNWINYNFNNGLVGDYITSIAIDNQNNKWIGTTTGISEFDDHTFKTYKIYPDNNVTAIAIDSAGNNWFGTNAAGIQKFDGKTWTSYSTKNGLINNNINTIAIDLNGDVWIGTYSIYDKWTGISTSGLMKFDGNKWIIMDALKLFETHISVIKIDGSGNKWIGNGTILKSNDSIAYYKIGDYTDGQVQSIAIDASGNKWFGTSDNGVLMLDKGFTYINSDKYTDSSVLIYPNPVTGELHISGSALIYPASISIYSINGRPVYTSKLNKNSFEMNMSNYIPGVYFVKILSGDHLITQKIVKK